MFIVPEIIFKITPGSNTIKDDILIVNYKNMLISFCRTHLSLTSKVKIMILDETLHVSWTANAYNRVNYSV